MDLMRIADIGRNASFFISNKNSLWQNLQVFRGFTLKFVRGENINDLALRSLSNEF